MTNQQVAQERQGDTAAAGRAMSDMLPGGWISVEEKEPLHTEPIVYARPQKHCGTILWRVGIAYWTVSKKWNPEAESVKCPDGFTHWMPLPEPPSR